MAHSGQHIINTVLKKHPKPEPIIILNQSDENLEASIQFTKQYIIGVTQRDHSGGIDNYRSWFQKAMSNYINPNFIDCLPFPFEPHDLEEMQHVLEEVAVYYNVHCDAVEMLKKAGINRRTENICFIVVTVITYPVVNAGASLPGQFP